MVHYLPDHIDGWVVIIVDDEDDLVFQIVEFEQRGQILPNAFVEPFAWGDDGGERGEGTRRVPELLAEVREILNPADEGAEAETDEDEAEEDEQEKHERQL